MSYSMVTFWSSSVYFDSFNSIQSILVYLVPFDDVLGGAICVKKGTVLLTIMSHSQCNIGMFLIKLQFSYVIKLLYFFFQPNIIDEFTYIYASL